MHLIMSNMHTRYRFLHLRIVDEPFRSGCLQHCKDAKQQNIRCIASSLKFFWYGSVEWSVEENFCMKWNMEWKIFSMEWK